MTEQAKVPSIRFAGFTDPWEQRKLGDVADLLTGYPFESRHFTDTGIPLVRGMNVKRGYLDMSADICENWSDAVGVEDYLLKAGDIVIQMDGALIGSSYAMVTPEDTPSLLVQRVTRVRCGNRSRYIFQAVQRGFLRYIKSLKTETAVPHLSLSDIADYAIPVPKEEREQEHIGSFFSRLDDLITLHQRKYDKLVVFKKSMLEKMFPKDGESVPEIRFAGFTDPWEQRKLGDVASSFDYGLNAAATEYDGQNKYLRITDIDDETHEFSKSDLTTPLADLAMSADYLLKEGDLLFARTGASVGKTYLYRQFDGMVYFAGFLIRARIGEGADPEFAYQATLTDAYKKYVAITSQRSGQPGVNAQEYADYQLMLPSKTEQQQIGMTLRSLDDLITLHQRKLELLRNIKKSLLDKMFV